MPNGIKELMFKNLSIFFCYYDYFFPLPPFNFKCYINENKKITIYNYVLVVTNRVYSHTLCKCSLLSILTLLNIYNKIHHLEILFENQKL